MSFGKDMKNYVILQKRQRVKEYASNCKFLNSSIFFDTMNAAK